MRPLPYSVPVFSLWSASLVLLFRFFPSRKFTVMWFVSNAQSWHSVYSLRVWISVYVIRFSSFSLWSVCLTQGYTIWLYNGGPLIEKWLLIFHIVKLPFDRFPPPKNAFQFIPFDIFFFCENVFHSSFFCPHAMQSLECFLHRASSQSARLCGKNRRWKFT